MKNEMTPFFYGAFHFNTICFLTENIVFLQ